MKKIDNVFGTKKKKVVKKKYNSTKLKWNKYSGGLFGFQILKYEGYTRGTKKDTTKFLRERVVISEIPIPSGKGIKPVYDVLILQPFKSIKRTFKTKSEAIKFSKDYMRKMK